MDHLDRPTQKVNDPIRIAYFCLEPYDNEPFMSYPLRQGYQLHDVINCDFRRTDPDRGGVTYANLPALQSFLQAWIFFGLLWEIHHMAGILFDEHDFITQDDFAYSSIRRVETSQLPQRLSTWKERFLNLSLHETEDYLRKFNICLNTAYKVCYKLVMTHQSIFDEKLLVSLMSLGNSLEGAMTHIFWACRHKYLENGELKDGEMNRIPGWVASRRGWDAPRLVFDEMAGRGWCPFELTFMRKNFDTNEIIYASQLARFGYRQRHRLCHEQGCIANNVDNSTYKTSHTMGCTGCEDVVLNYQYICSTIRRGRTPLVFSVEKGDRISFGVTSDDQAPFHAQDARTGKMPYICISHVWSHGLGNTRRNALPRCQLEILHKYTSSVLTKDDGGRQYSVFWIDTICVPVHPADKDLRQLSITNMESIYRDASCVLVLDEALMRTSLHSSPSENTFQVKDLTDQRELSIRIILSDWWRRLWTLQEGLLCHTFFIAFAEGPIHITNAIMTRQDDHFRNLAHTSSPVVKGMLMNLIDRQHEPQSLDFHRQVLTLVPNRSTSRAADEPVCLATLLGVDVRSILEISGEDKRVRRMKKLYELLGKIPAQLVFLAGSRLNIPCFRWAPDTLIGDSGPGMSSIMVSSFDEGEAVVTDGGLHLRAKGYRLASLGSSLKNDFVIVPGAPGMLYSDEEVPRIFDGTNTPGRSVTYVVPSGRPRPRDFQGRGVLYADDDLVDPVLISPSNRPDDSAFENAILASSPTEGADGRWHAKFLCPVECFTNPDSMVSQSENHRSSIRERLRKERSAVWNRERTGFVAWKKDGAPIMDWCIS